MTSLTMNGLLGIAAGRMMSGMLEMAIRRDLFARLRGRSVPLDELPGLWEMPGPSARLMAQYLTNVGLLTFQDGAFSNGVLAESTLAADSEPRRLLALLFKYDLSTAELEKQLLDPPVLHWYQLRDQGEISDQRPLVRQEREDWVRQLATQRHGQRIQLGKVLASRYDFSGHRVLVDLGGASGGYCLGIRKSNPHLRCIVFDLADAIDVAREKIAEAGESEHVDAVAGSFFTTPELPAADVALIANVLHTWAPAEDRVILRKIYDALAPGGTLLVRESFFEDDWSGSLEPVFDAFVLVGQEGKSGWQPSYAEMEELLREAGFEQVERRQDLVLGRKPRG
jgi:3-hydroxy-5-methyl-1-naphthoate 3-O-methyltransferase